MKTPNFRGDLTNTSAEKEPLVGMNRRDTAAPGSSTRATALAAVIDIPFLVSWTVILFSNLNNVFFGYFDRKNIFLNNKK